MDLDLTVARFAGPVVVIELDIVRGSVDIRLPEGASASIDDVSVYGAAPATVARTRRPRESARSADRPGGHGFGEHSRAQRSACGAVNLKGMRSALRAGVVSPTLPVPKSIDRPEYVGRSDAVEGSEPWVQTPRSSKRCAQPGASQPARSPKPARPSPRSHHR